MRSQVKEDGVLEVFLEGRIDSTNVNAFDTEVNALTQETNAKGVAFDCTDLEYVSSAGLRVFMRLRKRFGSLRVDNVSPDVYDIFEVTGFSSLLDVRKALREVDVSGLELLGGGATGNVYRLTDDQMIKVYRPGVTLDDVEVERKVSRQAFLLGIPSAIAFDTVRCGESYGTIYELLNAQTLSERITADPATLDECAMQSAKTYKEMHAVEVGKDVMPDATRTYYANLDRIASYFTDDENERLRSLLDAVPVRDRFTHNDYHPRNIMYSDGELMIIDLGEAGSGNPLLDWMHTYGVINLISVGMSERADDEMSFVGITYAHLHRYWKVFIETYFGDVERAERMETLLEPWAWFVYLASCIWHPFVPEEYRLLYAQWMREKVLARADGMVASLEEMEGLMTQ